MTTGTWKVVLLGAATSLVLAGCAGHPTPAADGPGAATTSASGQETGAGRPSPSGSAPNKGTGQDTPGEGASDGAGSTTDPGTDGSDGSSDAPDSGSGDGSALEMPEEPAPSVTSLQDLLDDVSSAPLVTAPLPRAASARGRLVTRFPAFLRPIRATTVGTSSISPSGSRLQASLTGTTSLTPEQVLVAYRTRLGGRGLTEITAPAAVAGSEAAAFERGRSVVTITATPDGTRTSYVVHATLHTGSE